MRQLNQNQNFGANSGSNPFVSLLAGIAGLGLLALIFWLGLILGVIVLGLAAVFAVYWKIRLWWSGKKQPSVGGQANHSAGQFQQRRTQTGHSTQGETLEGDYEVVDRTDNQ